MKLSINERQQFEAAKLPEHQAVQWAVGIAAMIFVGVTTIGLMVAVSHEESTMREYPSELKDTKVEGGVLFAIGLVSIFLFIGILTGFKNRYID